MLLSCRMFVVALCGFLTVQLFSFDQHHLSTVWVEPIGDTSTNHTFAIITPETRLALVAASDVDREDWISSIVQAIAALVEGDDGSIITMKNGVNVMCDA